MVLRVRVVLHVGEAPCLHYGFAVCCVIRKDKDN